MKTIALLEIGGAHDAFIFTQLHALHGHAKLLLIINTALLERNPQFRDYLDDVLLIDYANNTKDTKRTINTIWQYLKEQRVDTLVLNTAHGQPIRMLCMKALFHPMQFIGIAHVMRAFQVSGTQKLINLKVQKYLTLSEHLLSAKKLPKRIPLSYFYPLRLYSGNKQIKKTGPLVVIVGSVGTRRKDLDGFIAMSKNIDYDVEFVFLGRSDENKEEVRVFHAALDATGMAHRVRTFSHFVDQETFDAYLKAADLLLPLVHPDTTSAEQFFKNQIPAAMLMAFSYKIPLLLHQAYQHIVEMKTAAFYYTLANFKDTLRLALQQGATKKQLMQEDTHYNVVLQEMRFAKYVLGSDV